MLVLSGPFELAAVWMLKRRLRYKTARLVVGGVRSSPLWWLTSLDQPWAEHETLESDK